MQRLCDGEVLASFGGWDNTRLFWNTYSKGEQHPLNKAPLTKAHCKTTDILEWLFSGLGSEQEILYRYIGV